MSQDFLKECPEKYLEESLEKSKTIPAVISEKNHEEKFYKQTPEGISERIDSRPSHGNGGKILEEILKKHPKKSRWNFWNIFWRFYEEIRGVISKEICGTPGGSSGWIFETV